MRKRATIGDVARHANVSRASVSYVLNNIDKVSQATKTRILRSIEELEYQPDYTAVSLSKKQSKLIGVVLPEWNPLLTVSERAGYMNELVAGIEWVARENGYDVLISRLKNSEDCKIWINRRNLDAVIFAWDLPNKESINMDIFGIPLVLIDVYESSNRNITIGIDDELGGYLATRHLIELGHRSIAITMSDPKNSPVNNRRFQGYRKMLQEAGLVFNPQLLFECEGNGLENGLAVAPMILESSEPITAIFAASDLIAIGLMKAFQRYNKQVPEDYSIVGFDDLFISQYMTPSLTTVRQDPLKKGMAAAEMIFQALKSPTELSKTTHLPLELIVRDSTTVLNTNKR